MGNLVRHYSPVGRGVDRTFGVFLPSVGADTGTAGRSIALDVVETPEAYIVKAELPGIAKDKIEVNVEDRNVTIGAEFLDQVAATGKTPEYISEEEMAYMAAHGDAVMYPTLVKRPG